MTVGAAEVKTPPSKGRLWQACMSFETLRGGGARWPSTAQGRPQHSVHIPTRGIAQTPNQCSRSRNASGVMPACRMRERSVPRLMGSWLGTESV